MSEFLNLKKSANSAEPEGGALAAISRKSVRASDRAEIILARERRAPPASLILLAMALRTDARAETDDRADAAAAPTTPGTPTLPLAAAAPVPSGPDATATVPAARAVSPNVTVSETSGPETSANRSGSDFPRPCRRPRVCPCWRPCVRRYTGRRAGNPPVPR